MEANQSNLRRGQLPNYVWAAWQFCRCQMQMDYCQTAISCCGHIHSYKMNGWNFTTIWFCYTVQAVRKPAKLAIKIHMVGSPAYWVMHYLSKGLQLTNLGRILIWAATWRHMSRTSVSNW